MLTAPGSAKKTDFASCRRMVAKPNQRIFGVVQINIQDVTGMPAIATFAVVGSQGAETLVRE